MKRSGDWAAVFLVKSRMHRLSTPKSAISRARSVSVVRRGGALSGRSTRRGWGSKVQTVSGSPLSRASASPAISSA